MQLGDLSTKDGQCLQQTGQTTLFQEGKLSLSGMLGWFCSLPSHGGMETGEVNWSGSQTTGPIICDRSEEPLPDTIPLPLRTSQKMRFLPAFLSA